ncbi:MAG: RES family NAD+ phosphorylase [Hylemonella sp.]|nr:RES family NAD+ phosphorylase [Hylemonella sp.]
MASQKQRIPSKGVGSVLPPKGILELDRFSNADIAQWQKFSNDLDEFTASLYFGVEPARRRLRSKLCDALKQAGGIALDLQRWARTVTYQYSLQPLSCAGSLQSVGGRFNAGFELDDNTLNPWPALYMAEDFETAYREKFQLTSTDLTDGLKPDELALEHAVGITTIFLNGRMENVFDMTSFVTLNSVGRIFRDVKMPKEAAQLAKKLKIRDSNKVMVQNGQQLHSAIVKSNWRVWPMQFGIPAPSQTMAELIKAAGYEGILYPSSKGPGRCLAVFPENLSDLSHVDLIGTAPSAATIIRLDSSTSTSLEGWDSIPRNRRNI